MTTQAEAAEELYARLKPLALKEPRAFIMAHTPFYLADEMVGLIDEDIPPTEVPTVVDAPLVTQAAAVLSCTLGNWNGAPTARVYQWRVAGVVVGTNSASYTRVVGDIGKPATCSMVATNAVGSSAPTTSNEIIVT